jgi:hypothetical protein
MSELQNLATRPEDGAGAVLGLCGGTAAGAGRRRPVTQAVTGETLMSPNARSASASIYDRVRDRFFLEWVSSGQAARDRATAAAEALKHPPPASGPRTPPATPMPNPPVTAGRGWKVAEHPLRPHRELEAFAKKVWRLGFLNFPWPGYAIKWGDLRGLAACGLCRPDLRLIVICEQYYSIGEYSNAAHPSFDEMVGKQLAVMFHGRVPYEAREARAARLGR